MLSTNPPNSCETDEVAKMGLYSTNEVRRLRERLSAIPNTADRFRLLSEIGRHCVEEILAGKDRGLARIVIEMLLSEESDGKPFFSDKDISYINFFIDDGLWAVDECREISVVEDVKGGVKFCERPIAEWVREDDVGDGELEEDGEEEEPEETYAGTDESLWRPSFDLIFGTSGKDVDK